ncbi:MAG TPA: NUDIX domain-containing protein [Candidatus Saccharimonadales bacterium]|nr:NUDIX domain-containing protein [Candidatus Saccharimonadales bacterium]
MERFTGPHQEELLDIVDEFGRPTGKTATKAQIHAQGLLHRDTHIWVFNDEGFLQQHRAANKKIMPNTWDISVAGHVDVGEDYLDAAVRETEEELSLRYPRERFLPIGRLGTEMFFKDWSHPHRVVSKDFVVYDPVLDLSKVNIQDDEVQGVRLYRFDDFDRDLMTEGGRKKHAPQPLVVYRMGLAAMLAVRDAQTR